MASFTTNTIAMKRKSARLANLLTLAKKLRPNPSVSKDEESKTQEPQRSLEEVETLIAKLKFDLDDYYDLMKNQLDIRAHTLFAANEKSGKNESIKKCYLEWIENIDRVLNRSMREISVFVNDPDKMKLLSDRGNSCEELLAVACSCSVFVLGNDELKLGLKEKEDWLLGVLVECDWYLTQNQCLFLRQKLEKENSKESKLCLDQNLLNISLAFDRFATILNENTKSKGPKTSSKSLKKAPNRILLHKRDFQHFNVSTNNTEQNEIVLSSLNIETINARTFTIVSSSIVSNLVKLDLKHNRLTRIRADCFGAEMKSLRELILNCCQVEHLEAFAFRGLTQLKELHLASNRLGKLKENTFVGLDSLVKLHLFESGIDALETGCFRGLNSLQSLCLRHNRIAALPKRTFASLTSLVSLSLDRNRLQSLDNGGLAGLGNLIDLDLDHNHFDTVARGWFNTSLKSLKELSLNDCSIRQIQPNAFRSLQSLTDLCLNNNKLTRIEKLTLAGLTSLQTLEMRKNCVQTMAPGCFASASRIRGFFLSNNSLGMLHANQFRGLDGLEKLNLEKSAIWRMEAGCFDGLANLKHLYLSMNKLAQIGVEHFPAMNGLVLLYLAQNRIESIGDGCFRNLRSLEKLNLNNNGLKQVRADVFEGLANLKELNLRYNQLENLDKSVFDQLTKAKIEIDGTAD